MNKVKDSEKIKRGQRRKAGDKTHNDQLKEFKSKEGTKMTENVFVSEDSTIKGKTIEE